MDSMGVSRATRGKGIKRSVGPRTKQEQREETREKLLVAARHLFLASGFKATTLEKVATRAGLTKGAVYFHFRSKERLLLTLLDSVNEEVIKPVLRVLSSEQEASASKLVNFVHVHAELGLRHRDNMLLLVTMSIEFSENKGAVHSKVKQIYQSIYDELERVIRAGQAAGELKRNAPAKEMASVLVANHNGALLEWYRRGNEINGDNLVRAVRAIMVEGIFTPNS